MAGVCPWLPARLGYFQRGRVGEGGRKIQHFCKIQGVKEGVLCLSEEERKEGEKSPSLISCLRFCRLERLEEGELPLKLGEAEHSSLCCHCSSSSSSFLFPVLILDWEPTPRMAKAPNIGVSVVLSWQGTNRARDFPALMGFNSFS